MDHGSTSRLRQLLESYGADRGRWPEADRGIDAASADEAAAEARDIDAVLSLASQPPAAGSIADLMARLDDPAPSQVIKFPARPRSRPFFRFAAALPLAASLAFGAYLGASGTLDFMLPSAVTGGVALNDDAPDDLGGVDDVAAFAQDGLT
jgi:hypothetical protein